MNLLGYEFDCDPGSTKRTIFHGSPSQVVNLPTTIFGVIVLLVVLVLYLSISIKWPVNGFFLMGLEFIVISYLALQILRTAYTEIIIDTERITLRTGILNKVVSSLELFRVQDVISIHPWWQRFFNVGTIVVISSDTHNQIFKLPGVFDAESMRNELNRASIALRDKKGIREINMGRL